MKIEFLDPITQAVNNCDIGHQINLYPAREHGKLHVQPNEGEWCRSAKTRARPIAHGVFMNPDVRVRGEQIEVLCGIADCTHRNDVNNV